MAIPLLGGLGIGGGGASIYGRRPEVPGPIDYGAALERTIGQNIAAIPSLADLATQSTQLYSQLMETAYPGITNLKKLGTEQIQSFLHGEIPQDVSEQLQRIGAEKGAASGTTGSPFNRALTARDLGLTSLSLIQGGLSAAERWITQARSQTFDFSRMFYGPEDTQRQAENEWNRQWLAAQVAASPNPQARGEFDSQMALLGMVLSAYGGGPGYQGTYRSPYQGGTAGPYGAYQGGMAGGRAGSFFGEYGQTGGNINDFGAGSEGIGQGTGENFPI
jgi:hypothetical protein